MKKLENPKFYIDKMILNNYTMDEACNEFSLHHETLRKYCRKFDHVPPRKKKYKDDMLANLLKIVEETNCTQASVCGGDRQLEKALSRYIKRNHEGLHL